MHRAVRGRPRGWEVRQERGQLRVGAGGLLRGAALLLELVVSGEGCLPRQFMVETVGEEDFSPYLAHASLPDVRSVFLMASLSCCVTAALCSSAVLVRSFSDSVGDL